ATIEALGRRFQTLLAGILADPGQRLSDLPLLPAAERLQLGLDGSAMATPEAADAGPYRLLHETVEDHAARRPEAPAVALDGLALTYAELNSRANQLAHFLAARGIVPGDRVGLCLERSPEAVAGILGVLKAGAAYVPLDPSYPPDRLEGMAADARLALRLTGSDLAAAGDEIAARSAVDPRLDLPPESLAYVLFTSGSTGRPKGVACAHAGVLNVLEESHRRHPLPPGAVHATWGSFSFDLAVQEIFLAFREGGRLEIVPEAERVDGRAFARWLAEREIESAFVAPPLLPDLRDFVAAPGPFPAVRLRRALTGLEAIPERLLAEIASHVPGLRFQDGYGPTEATILVTVYETGGERPPGEVPETDTPLGRPIRNVRLVLLDREGNPVPGGVPGELAIAGPGLAWGYPGRPDLTAERFRPDPFGGLDPVGGGRLYWSGDRVRRRADGLLELLGRVDRQVKIRGFRVEPGEIEAALAALPGVREAAVVVRTVRGGERTLAAFVAPREADLELRPADLVAGLRQRLPEPMIPASVTPLPALPRTANGKIDRAALARLEPLGSRTAERRRAAVPPRTPVEQVLAAIWTEVLGLDPAANPPVGPVGADDNFFELSGHSLLAAQVAYRVRQTFGVDLPLRRLFERATLSELAREIEAEQGKPGAGREDDLRPLSRQGAGTAGDGPRTVPSSLLQEWMWKLQGGPVSPLYNFPSALRARGPLDLAALGHSLYEMRRRHETLRSRFEMRDGRLWQIVEPLEPEAPLPLVDLTGLPELQKVIELYRLANEDAARPFDLTRAPLIRLTVVRMAPLDQALLFNTHHTVSDGWSMELLERDMALLYGAFSRGEPSPLAELPVQYSDFAAWQRRLLEERRGLDAQLAEWKRRLADLPPVVTVPTDRPYPADGKLGPALVNAEVQIGGEVLPALQALAHASGCSLHMALLAGVEALLYRYTGQQDMVVGSIFAGRDRPELADLIGVFLNLVPLRTDLSGSPSFRTLLLRARETVLAAYSLQDTPFSLLLAELFPDRPASRTLLFRVLFNLLSFPLAPEPDGAAGGGLPGDLSFEPMVAVREEARYDLVFEAREGPGFVHFTLKGAADLYKQATLARVAKDFESLLSQAVTDPDIHLDRLLPTPNHRPRPEA
ncbi:MAG TPA: amino acid adenylation domain-containing protein, partial [Thermoanaerobaculia bacterium]|nr:amino acid adenylation domain-containing protein [Thermoanaerobaculia bacterium]